jgi:pimeloyl-ACP methyl ester carboxylesterase
MKRRSPSRPPAALPDTRTMPAAAPASPPAGITPLPGFVDIGAGGRTLRIECRWVGGDVAAPLVVFLHEGLGSVSMWRDFPDRLRAAAGCRGFVYSRPGYGRSTPRDAGERWAPDFMHRQAFAVLPALLRALAIATPPWLLGHSDGGSIALLHASRHPVAGCVVMAPHILVEPVSVTSIEKARRAYLEADLRQRLARHHDDPDSAFWGWNDIWLDPAFRSWTIQAEIAAISAPLLAIQGLDDEYGTCLLYTSPSPRDRG